MKIRNISARNLTLRDSSGNQYAVPAYSDTTVSDTLWNDNEFRRWVRMRIRDIAVVDTSASISASTLINTGDPLSVPFTVRGAGGQATDLLQIENSTTAVIYRVSKDGYIGVGTAPLVPAHLFGPITGSGGQLRLDANSSNSNAAISLFPNRSGTLFEAARVVATYNGALQGQLVFYTNDGSGTLQQRGMFNETGFLGIGATPTKLLDIATSATGDVATFRTTASGGQGLLFGVDTANTRAYVRLNTTSTYSYAIEDISGNPFISFLNTDGKVYFGAVQDSNLYRSAASTLKTDGNFVVTGTLTTGSIAFTSGSITGSLNITQDLTARNGAATQVFIGSVVSANAGLTFGSAADTNFYRVSPGVLQTDGTLKIGANAATALSLNGAAAGLTISGDTNLYRLSAGVLKTDGALTVVGALTTAAATHTTVTLNGNSTTLEVYARNASELTLHNQTSNGTAAIRLKPSGTDTDVLTISSIGNVTMPVTAANTTPTLFLGAENVYRASAGILKTDSIFNAVGGIQVNGTSIFLTQTNTQASSYTLVLADANKLIEMNSGSANTLTIPTDASVAFPVGTVINVSQLGAGTTTIAAAGGVTLRTYNSHVTFAGQYAVVSLVKRAANDWWVAGNLV